jgi:hypothetical protein
MKLVSHDRKNLGGWIPPRKVKMAEGGWVKTHEMTYYLTSSVPMDVV